MLSVYNFIVFVRFVSKQFTLFFYTQKTYKLIDILIILILTLLNTSW